MHRYLKEVERQLNKLKRNNNIDKGNYNGSYNDGFGTRRECLERMRDALMNIEREAPETFYEALQLLTLANEMMYCENIPSGISLGGLIIICIRFTGEMWMPEDLIMKKRVN